MTVAAPFRGRSFVYRQTDSVTTSDYYTEWVVAPGAMLADAPRLARSTRSRAFTHVFRRKRARDGDFVLDGFVDAFYFDLRDAAKPAAEIRSPTSSRAAIRSRACRSGRSSTSGACTTTARPRRSRRPRCRRLSPRSRRTCDGRPGRRQPAEALNARVTTRALPVAPQAANDSTLSGPADATRMSRCGSGIEMPASANALSIMWREVAANAARVVVRRHVDPVGDGEPDRAVAVHLVEVDLRRRCLADQPVPSDDVLERHRPPCWSGVP